MDIVIIDKSGVSSVRLGNIVAGIEGVQNIVQILDMKKIPEVVGRINPDVIIWDLNTSGTDSFELIREVLRLNPSALIVALTSYSVERYRKKCREIGVYHCLDKTTEFEKIVKIISGKRKNHNKEAGTIAS